MKVSESKNFRVLNIINWLWHPVNTRNIGE